MNVVSLLRRVVFLCTAIGAPLVANAQTLLAGWDFQTTTNGGTAVLASPNTPSILKANVGAQAGTASIFANGTNGSSSFTTSELSAFTGTSVNATTGTGLSTTTTSPASLAIVGTSANNKALTFTLSMTGYKDLVVSFATQKTSTGYTGNQWAYSTDGTNFTNFGNTVAPASSYATITLSTLTAVNYASSVWLRYTLTGSTGTSQNNRLDNIQFNATASAIPEPSTYAALAGAAALVGVIVHRRRQRLAAKA